MRLNIDLGTLGCSNVWTNGSDSYQVLFHIERSRSFSISFARDPFVLSNRLFRYLCDTGRVLAPYSGEIITEAIVPSAERKKKAGGRSGACGRIREWTSRDSHEKFKSMARRALEANSFHGPFSGSREAARLRLACLNHSSVRNVKYQSLRVIDVGSKRIIIGWITWWSNPADTTR